MIFEFFLGVHLTFGYVMPVMCIALYSGSMDDSISTILSCQKGKLEN